MARYATTQIAGYPYHAPVKDIVIQTDRRLDNMVSHLGYRSVPVHYAVSRAPGKITMTDKELIGEMVKRLSQSAVIKDRELTFSQFAHLKLARVIAEDFVDTGPVKAAIIRPASDMVSRTAGLYEFGTAVIQIHVTMLERAEDTVGVMVHELGHHVAYLRTDSQERAGDLTPDHAKAMEYVAGKIFGAVATGKYDEYLKEATW